MPDFPKVEIPVLMLEGIKSKTVEQILEVSQEVTGDLGKAYKCCACFKIGHLYACRYQFAPTITAFLKSVGGATYADAFAVLTKDPHDVGEVVTNSLSNLPDYINGSFVRTNSATYVIMNVATAEAWATLVADTDVYVSLWIGGYKGEPSVPDYTAYGKVMWGCWRIQGRWE